MTHPLSLPAAAFRGRRRASTPWLAAIGVAAMPALLPAQPTPAAPPPAAPGMGQVTGTVVAAGSARPLAAAAVAVRAAADSALVGGAIARPDGSFRVEGLREGRYLVRVRSMGFVPLVRTIEITRTAPHVQLGAVALDAAATQLEAVAVEGEHDAAVLAPDRNRYTVEDMPVVSGGTAVDVLRNIPSVDVDGDNVVSLRGNGGVVVQINGRSAPMRGEQLGAFLAQLPANVVSSVEVVTNPSAKNDPDGMAGIINIVLRQEADLGSSGALTVGGGTTRQLTVSGNLGYQQGAWTLFGSYGFMRDQRTVDGSGRRTDILGQPSGTPAAHSLDSDTHGLMRPSSHTGTATVEYRVTPRTTIAGNLILNDRGLSRENASAYHVVATDGDVLTRADQWTGQEQDGQTADAVLSLRRIVQPQRDALSVEAGVNRGRGRNDVVLVQEPLAVPGPDGSPATAATHRERNETDERSTSLFAQVDWTVPVGAAAKLELGYKGTAREQTSDFAVGPATGVPVLHDGSRDNAFAYHEDVHAAYGVVSAAVGRTSLQAGLRLEDAATRFELSTGEGETFRNDYRSVFPSAAVTYDLTPERQLRASYSKRINRPAAQQLNPFGFREDAATVFEGNPALRPEYTHSYELGYQQPVAGIGTLQLTPFLRHTVNAVRQIGTVDDAGVLRMSLQNAATSKALGTDANLSLRAGPLNGFGGVTLYHQRTDADNLPGARSASTFGWSARTSLGWKLSASLDAQTSAMYRAPERTEQGRMSSMSMLTLALRQKLRGDRASMTLRVQDPFGTMGWTLHTNDGAVLQSMTRRFGARGVFLNVNVNFGEGPRIRQRPPEEVAPPPGVPGIPGAG
jgi:ferric enterobactin receptor